ncbi:hypothetical protein GQ43DRAFT_444306 [Delitschia confertaspora ATCC 74209]|uniref:Btz domain-containing protein n=1 Tax=Delitschia confertaspora ATCC 74209 TaxID=1513339 RepID=A0A9P4JIN3_9PLEO|nr:hypothetical protein GQ43DRAFT_444306 [Delitschia confertaspora ATCC 74209]
MSPGRYGTAKTELEMEVERRRLNRRRDVSKERSRSPSLPIPPLRHEMREYHPNDLENELRCRPYDRGNHRGNHLGPHNPGWGGQGEREGGHIDHGLGVVTITPPRGWEEWYAAMDRKEAEERRGDHGRGGRIHRAEGPKTPPEGWIEYAQQWYDDEYRGQAGGRGDFETQGGDPRRGIRPRVGGHCGERTHPRENPHTRTDTDARAHTHHRVHTHHHVLHPEECIQEVMAPPHAQTPSPLPVPPVTFPHNPLPEQHQSPAQTAANPSVQFYSSYSDLDPNFYPQFYPHAVPENPNYYVAYDPFKPPQPPRQVLHYSEHCWILGQDHDPPPHDQPQEPHRQLWYEPYPGPLNLYHAPHRPVPVPAPSPAPQAPQSRQPHQGPDSRARARAKTSPAIPSPRRASIFGRPPALQHDRLKSNAYYLPLLNYLRLPPPIYLRPPPFPAPHAPHNYPRPRASPSRPRSAPPLWGPNGRSRQPEGTTNKGRGYGYDTTGVAPPPGNPPNNSGTGQHRMHKPTRPQAERSHAARDRTSAAGEAEGGQRWEEDGELRMRAAGPAGYDGMHADERYRVVSRNGRAVRDV